MKKLTKLVVTEISSVDRGAGENCHIVLLKRDDPDEELMADGPRAARRRMQELADKLRPTRKEIPMPDTIESIVKAHGGIVAIAKNIVTAGDSAGFTEQQFTEEVAKQARRDGVPFEKLYSTPEIWQAQNIVRDAPYVAKTRDLMNITPVQVDGRDFSAVNDDKNKAIEALNAMVEEQRRRSPTKTVEQLFAEVIQQPENADLARRSLGRAVARSPGPTT